MMNLQLPPHYCKTDVMRSVLVHADCFDIFPYIADKSVNLILCDLPYGTTSCKWDIILPLDKLWKEYKRISNTVILFSSQPFTTDLINSARDWFKYELIWDKVGGSNFQLSKVQPLKRHENILIFGNGKTLYNPQMKIRNKPKDYSNSSYNALKNGMHFNSTDFESAKKLRTEKYPDSIIEIGGQSKECNNVNRIHNTQKPLELLHYLIKTYSNEDDVVMDNCMGSNTTGLACKELNRQYIGIEKDKNYYDVSVSRVMS
jgi:site-specific DNA-methyltransferase (adenine-specific)